MAGAKLVEEETWGFRVIGVREWKWPVYKARAACWDPAGSGPQLPPENTVVTGEQSPVGEQAHERDDEQ